MTSSIPHRSYSGCLTCRQRRKKCDETKPFCVRCTKGDYKCLGYSQLPRASSSKSKHTEVEREAAASELLSNIVYVPVNESLYNTYSSLDEWTITNKQRLGNALTSRQADKPPNFVPRGVLFDPAAFSHMIPLILSQYQRFQRRIFRYRPTEEGLTQRVIGSNITRWTMYIQAKVAQAFSDGGIWEHYLGWVDRFHGELIQSPASSELTVNELRARLSGLHDLCTCAYMIADTRKGYPLFKKCIPLLLQLVAKYPGLWSSNSSISIARALHAQGYEIKCFVFFDTMSALALGTPPFLHYDAAFPAHTSGTSFMEQIYGCPAYLVVLLAYINAWRASEWLGQARLEYGAWREAEQMLREWSPHIEDEDESSNFVQRFAVQECWRHAVFIYLYMGRCDVDSADPRVQASVRQVVQLASTVEPGGQFELHLSMPCLVAGVAAQQEMHRATLLKKIRGSDKVNVWVVRGADFVSVLDHLWRGVGADGRPTTWGDYVNSRCIALPLDV
ncbi:hypothetical protein BDV93DRAFT_606492 [Ceratobasidium sp. AG-I]|nr:hypothetical protein BDV93DRAFT_606492 [Ceratobasidium sp. AG-I]